jgi:hypothetical protein
MGKRLEGYAHEDTPRDPTAEVNYPYPKPTHPLTGGTSENTRKNKLKGTAKKCTTVAPHPKPSKTKKVEWGAWLAKVENTLQNDLNTHAANQARRGNILNPGYADIDGVVTKTPQGTYSYSELINKRGIGGKSGHYIGDHGSQDLKTRIGNGEFPFPQDSTETVKRFSIELVWQHQGLKKFIAKPELQKKP